MNVFQCYFLLRMIGFILSLLTISTLSNAQSCGGTSPIEIQGFLSVHNNLRSSISAGTYVAKGRNMPPAKTSIPNLTWDCNLERSAQTVANSCVFAHSSGRDNVGENLYAMWSSGIVTKNGQGRQASMAWEKEFQDYGWSDIKLTMNVFNSGIGHATQMVWSSTTKIGCGISLCQDNKQVLTVCHYSPAGNFLNTNVYDPK